MQETRLNIRGGKRLEGNIRVSGGKNASVALIPAALLAGEPCVLENVPDIQDVRVLLKILREVGAKVEFAGDTLTVDGSTMNTHAATSPTMHRMRASYYLLGVLLGMFGRASIASPGGCDIGARPIDQHIKGLKALGADIENKDGVLSAVAEKGVHGAEIYLDVYSVGATINIMLAAVLGEGRTVITNAAKEPHIVDLANFLNAMGAYVRGAGTDIIRIKGVPKLHGCYHSVIPDQIETGTLMIAAAATCGDVLIEGAIPAHMEAISAKLLEMGVRVKEGEDLIAVQSDGRHRAVSIKTLPYPGFPTDLQQPFAALLTTAKGKGVITETIFESRFRYVTELARMGADISQVGRFAYIEGVSRLTGALVDACDLRAGAALVVAGLMAEGETRIREVHYIDRGYENFERKLVALGADIERVRVDV